MTSTIRRHDAVPLFSDSYAQARERFLAAKAVAARMASYPIEARGARDEALSTDVALIGDAKAERLLIMTSATHGAEGFCGSGCQLACWTMRRCWRARDSGVALLLVHAVNPYGFSWIARTDEGNVDLNRNAQPFDGRPLPENPGYAALHPLLLPESWPPTEANQREQALHRRAWPGHLRPGRLARAVHACRRPVLWRRSPGGLAVEHAAHPEGTCRRFSRIGWIDVHTGLGPRGHGEKIYAGRRDEAEVARARHWYGADIAVPYQGSSASVDITGQLASVIYDACPTSTPTLMALEFGTQPFADVVQALRGRNWLRAHPEASEDARRAILKATLDAFYCGDADWHGMVLGQSRVAVLQALCGLQGD